MTLGMYLWVCTVSFLSSTPNQSGCTVKLSPVHRVRSLGLVTELAGEGGQGATYPDFSSACSASASGLLSSFKCFNWGSNS